MKIFLYIIVCCLFASPLFYACDSEIENENEQKPFTVDEQYYENLRNYKKTDHSICFGWYAGYSNVGSPSMADHFVGLPDSMDIVSLWMGVPSGDLLEEMYEVRRKKGTRFVLCSFCQIKDSYPHTDEGLEQLAMGLVDVINRYDLDGLDIDFEPGQDWVQGEVMEKLVKILGRHLGPQSGTGKLFIMDYARGAHIPTEVMEPYFDYVICQTYTSSMVSELQDQFDRLSKWYSPKKFIVTEQIGWYWQNGGVSFTEANGNKVDSWGNPLYSLMGMARWNPTQGRKGGFGAYYFEYEYNTNRPANQAIGDTESKPISYYSLRRGIQEQNPAVK